MTTPHAAHRGSTAGSFVLALDHDRHDGRVALLTRYQVITERSRRKRGAIRHAARWLDIQPAWLYLYIQPSDGAHTSVDRALRRAWWR